MSHRVRLASELDASIAELQLADDRNDEDGAWTAVQHVLTCLYRFEEQERADDVGYYRHRADLTEGRTVAGLIWLRGLIGGHQAEIRAHLFRPFAISADDNALQPLTVRTAPGGPLVALDGGEGAIGFSRTALKQPGDAGAELFSEVLLLVDNVHWPERRHLPAPGRRYKAHQRDAYYDTLVAGQPLMEPLRAARSYFLEKR